MREGQLDVVGAAAGRIHFERVPVGAVVHHQAVDRLGSGQRSQIGGSARRVVVLVGIVRRRRCGRAWVRNHCGNRVSGFASRDGLVKTGEELAGLERFQAEGAKRTHEDLPGRKMR